MWYITPHKSSYTQTRKVVPSHKPSSQKDAIEITMELKFLFYVLFLWYFKTFWYHCTRIEGVWLPCGWLPAFFLSHLSMSGRQFWQHCTALTTPFSWMRRPSLATVVLLALLPGLLQLWEQVILAWLSFFLFWAYGTLSTKRQTTECRKRWAFCIVCINSGKVMGTT